jgi:hypothetical protein
MAVLYNSQAKNQWLDKVLFSNKEEWNYSVCRKM